MHMTTDPTADTARSHAIADARNAHIDVNQFNRLFAFLSTTRTTIRAHTLPRS